jgi:hypothetical protein
MRHSIPVTIRRGKKGRNLILLKICRQGSGQIRSREGRITPAAAKLGYTHSKPELPADELWRQIFCQHLGNAIMIPTLTNGLGTASEDESREAPLPFLVANTVSHLKSRPKQSEKKVFRNDCNKPKSIGQRS